MLLATAFALHALTAAAQQEVILFEAAALRPELCATLRIQLTDIASVSCRPEPVDAPLPERLARASRAIEEQGARLGVLLERDPDPALVRMVLVGTRADQAVLAIERIEDRADPEVDRSLALKVRDVLDVLEVTRDVVQARAPLPAVLTERAPRDSRGELRALLEAGGALSLSQQTRGVGLIGAGARFAVGARALELGALAHLTSRIDERVRDGRVDEREWGVAISGRATRGIGRLALGAALELGMVRIDARGETRDGRSGASQLTRLRAALGLDLRLALLDGLALRFAPAIELYPVAQGFALEERPNLELGRVRALLPLSLVVDVGRRAHAH